MSIISGLINLSIKYYTDALKAVGVKDSGMAVQVGTIGTATLAGALLARKKSLLFSMLYPVIGGGSVWAVFYYSVPENRTHTLSLMEQIQARYTNSKK